MSHEITPVQAEAQGSESVEGHGWSARILPGPPLISPARAFVFPHNIPGEEDALARGSLWIQVRTSAQPPTSSPATAAPATAATPASFVAQCALGFATGQVAHGLWTCAATGALLALAGGYAYRIHPHAPETTALLPMRPVVGICSLPGRAATVLVGFHTVLILQENSVWQSDRLSWEGIALTGYENGILHGLGWDMATDEEVPFTLNLRTRQASGGGHRIRHSEPPAL